MSDIVEKITEAYQRDQSLKGQPTPVGELPLEYESLTPAWLSDVLCKDAPGAEVISFTLDERDDGSSNRRRIFMRYNAEGEAAGLPASAFCKASHDLQNRLVLGISGGAHCEAVFYNEIRPHIDIEGPASFLAKVNPETFNSLIMLEDLTSSARAFCNHHTVMTRQRAESQVKLLATVHGNCYVKAQPRAALEHLPSWYDYFCATQAFGMESGSNNGFLAAEEVVPPRLYKRYKEIWPTTLRSAKMHDALPHTLGHGDVHLKNWYVAGNGEMGLTDWQCCHRGHWSRDLAYTLSTALKTPDRRAWERDLLRMYLELLVESGGPKVDFDEAWTLYRSQMMSALTWWTVTLTPPEGLPDMQPRDITLDFIQRISTAIDDLDSLDAVNSYMG